jgi:hypothetical protein
MMMQRKLNFIGLLVLSIGPAVYGANDTIDKQIECAKALGLTGSPYILQNRSGVVPPPPLDIQAVAFDGDGKTARIYLKESSKLKTLVLKSRQSPPFRKDEVFQIPVNGEMRYYRVEAVRDPLPGVDTSIPIGINLSFASHYDDSSIVKKEGFTPYSEISTAENSDQALRQSLEREIKKYPAMMKSDLASHQNDQEVLKKNPAAARAMGIKELDYQRPFQFSAQEKKVSDLRAEIENDDRHLDWTTHVYNTYHKADPNSAMAKSIRSDIEAQKTHIQNLRQRRDQLEDAMESGVESAYTKPQIKQYRSFRKCPSGIGLDKVIAETETELEALSGEKFPPLKGSTSTGSGSTPGSR